MPNVMADAATYFNHGRHISPWYRKLERERERRCRRAIEFSCAARMRIPEEYSGNYESLVYIAL